MANNFSLMSFLEGKNYYGYDKELHVFISALIVIIFASGFNLLVGIAVGIGFSLAKELFDLFVRKESLKWSALDFLADVIGVILGIIIVFLALK